MILLKVAAWEDQLVYALTFYFHVYKLEKLPLKKYIKKKKHYLAFLAERSGVWLLDEGELETADTFCVRFLFYKSKKNVIVKRLCSLYKVSPNVFPKTDYA